MPLEGRIAMMAQAEEVEHAVVDRLRIGEEPAAVHYVYPVAADQLAEPFQLVGVETAGQVGVVLMTVAEVSGLADDPLGLSGQALVLQSRARSNGSVSYPLASSCACAE